MKREVVIELKLEDQGAVNRLGKLEIETKRYQQELRALNAEILKNGEATAQQTSRVGELNARIRNNQGQIRELKNDLSGLTDAGLRFRDKMAQAFGQTLKPLFDNLNNSLAKTQGEMAQALKTFGAESIQFQKAAESVERLEKGMTELKQAQDQASAAIVKFGENSKEFKEANERLKGLETTAQELALQVAEHVEPKFVALNRQLREARREAQEAAEKFGFMSQEFQAAANKADDLEDQMKAVNATVQAIDTEGKIETFGKALQGVTGAFSLAQGAAALFGSESEKVEKALLKVQAAIAIQQGVSGLIEGTKAARALAMSVGLIGPAAQIGSAGINGMKAALISSGIGAAVVLIGTLAASMLELADNTEKARIAEEGRQKAAAKMADLKLAEISAEEELALLQGKRTQLEVDKARATRESLKSVEEERKALAEAEAKYKEQITLLKELEAQNNKVNEPQILFLREQTKALEGTIKSNRAIISQSEENLAKTFQILDLRKKEGKAQEDATEGTEKGTGAIKKQAAALRVLTDTMREFEQLQKQLESGQGIGPMAVINPTAEDAAPGVPLGPSPAVQAAVVEGQALAQAYSDDVDAYTEAQRAKIAVADEFADALGGLTQLLGEQTAAGKTFATAQALINTYLGVTQILANKTTLPEPAATIQKTLAVAGTLASGLAAVRRIQGFAEGGVVQQADGPRYTANRGDSVLISAAPGEVVLTRDQQLRLKALAGHRIFNDIGVPGFASGGLVRGTALANMPRTPSSGAVANAELSRAINSIDMSPVVRVTEIMDVMRSVQVAQSAASL
jgi:hypothetical protein